MFDLLDVSLWVILISGALNMGLGILWYGPLFGKAWMDGMGFKEEDKGEMQKTAGPAYAASLVFALLFGYALDLIINLAAIETLWAAFVLAAVIYIGLVVTNTMKPLLWGETKAKVFKINTLFEVVFLLIMTVVAFYL